MDIATIVGIVSVVAPIIVRVFFSGKYSATGKAVLKVLPDVVGFCKVVYEAFKGTHDDAPPSP